MDKDPDCLFCRIVEGDIPAEIIFETDNVLAFKDINPQAPFHALVIPKKHIATINDIAQSDWPLIGEMYSAASQIADSHGFAQDGYRTVMNCNNAGGQTVYHIHLHLLGGRQLVWPPG